jgi:P-type Ca2+ transporter type 2C
MDTLAALALASAPPNRKILNRKPDRKTAPLLSADMLKMILGQAFYQAIVCLVLHFAGLQILNEPHNTDTESELSSLVFK